MLEAVENVEARRQRAEYIALACFKMRENPETYGKKLIPLYALLAFMAGDFRKGQAFEGEKEHSTASLKSPNLKRPGVSLTLASKAHLKGKTLTQVFSLSEQAFVSLVVLKYLKSDSCQKEFGFADTNTVENAVKMLSATNDDHEEDSDDDEDLDDDEEKEQIVQVGANQKDPSNTPNTRSKFQLLPFQPSAAKPYNKEDHDFFTQTLRAIIGNQKVTEPLLTFHFPECDVPTTSESTVLGQGKDKNTGTGSSFDLMEMPPLWESI